jgi:hypothetical protein
MGFRSSFVYIYTYYYEGCSKKLWPAQIVMPSFFARFIVHSIALEQMLLRPMR